jgi:hypothetical protein
MDSTTLVDYYCQKLESHKIQNDNDFVSLDISLSEFINNIVTIFRLGTHQLELAYYQLEFLLSMPNTEYTHGNCYRLWLCSLMIIHKFFEDIPFSNRVWSRYSGFSLSQLNSMELEFLKCCQFRILYNSNIL